MLARLLFTTAMPALVLAQNMSPLPPHSGYEPPAAEKAASITESTQAAPKDLLTIAENYCKTGMFWQDGDFNHDGVVNAEDLLLAAENYGEGTAFGPYTQASLDGNFSTAWASRGACTTSTS